MNEALDDWQTQAGDEKADAPIKASTFESRTRPVDLATSLLPGLRKWFHHVLISDANLAAKRKAAIAPLGKCSPTFGVALLRTWCDAWKTVARRGLPATACILCGRRDADSSKHLARCPVLWRVVARVSAIPPPTSLADAIALRPSGPFGSRLPSGRHPPATFMLRLALACDTYHNLEARCDEAHTRTRPFGDGTIRAAVVNAWRRVGAI